jgi:hypothetical protein
MGYVANFVKRALNAAKNIVLKAVNAIKQKFMAAFNAVKNAFLKVFRAAKAVFTAILSKIKKLLKMIPRFRYLRLGHLYMKCLLDPLHCKLGDIKLPSIEICFSVIGCLGPTPSPSLNDIGGWIKKNIFGAIGKWFKGLFNWKTLAVKIPVGLKWEHKMQYLKIAKGLQTYRWCKWGKCVTVPHFPLRAKYARAPIGRWWSHWCEDENAFLHQIPMGLQEEGRAHCAQD